MNPRRAEATVIPIHRVTPSRAQTYRFGTFVLDRALFELRSLDERVPVAPKVFDLILYLVENHDRVVTHLDLRATLWPGVTVTDASLTYTVMAARRVLGDAGHTQRFIRCVRSRGYRFVAQVQSCSESAEDPGLLRIPNPRHPRRRPTE